ncbi:hypothetical protein MSG28_001064 [Choristoneura fumiferana]|uniref:Uncharacterized protein n=1 Tax=Choristoneura fumiferana TaxID=7141 RepID=A0ACC0K405_CHOFU|nr:hypothetical protein MSG28_001064 [Choristoneura fumiferana]
MRSACSRVAGVSRNSRAATAATLRAARPSTSFSHFSVLEFQLLLTVSARRPESFFLNSKGSETSQYFRRAPLQLTHKKRCLSVHRGMNPLDLTSIIGAQYLAQRSQIIVSVIFRLLTSKIFTDSISYSRELGVVQVIVQPKVLDNVNVAQSHISVVLWGDGCGDPVEQHEDAVRDLGNASEPWFLLSRKRKDPTGSFSGYYFYFDPYSIKCRTMIREMFVSSDEDDIESQCDVDPERAGLTRPNRDMHNRCCGGKAWCIKFVVMMVMLLPGLSTYPLYSYVNIFLFQSFAFLAFASHLRTMFTDPGAVPKGNATKKIIKQMSFREGQVIFKCTKCCSIKPERAHHCSVCQRCIRKMDHHCPWVNNCWRDCSTYSPPATVVLLLFLIAEALLFAIFTVVMLGTQLHAIWNDETMIVYVFYLLAIVMPSLSRPYDPEDDGLKSVLPSSGEFEAFYPREAHGIPNGSSRPAHGHGSFYKHRNPALVDMRFVVSLALIASSDAFFLKWGSDTTRQPSSQKWVQQMSPNMSPAYRYQYYSPYEPRKVYQMAPQQYQPEIAMPQSMAPIPISVPAGASLTPVSLQHVQLVPCMCPVAPEEAEKLQEQVGPGPYLAQTYAPQSYPVPQQMTLLFCMAVFLAGLLSEVEGAVRITVLKLHRRKKKVVIHVPYKVKKIKHVHTVYKTIHHHHTHHEHEPIISPSEEHEHFHHNIMHIHDDPGAGQHSQPVPGIGIPEFLPDVPLDPLDVPGIPHDVPVIPNRHIIPLFRRNLVKVFDSLPGGIPSVASNAVGGGGGYQVTEEGEEEDDTFTAIDGLQQSYPATFAYVRGAASEPVSNDLFSSIAPVQSANHNPFAESPVPTAFSGNDFTSPAQAQFSSLAPTQHVIPSAQSTPEFPVTFQAAQTGFDDPANSFTGADAGSTALAPQDRPTANDVVSYSRVAGVQQAITTGGVETVVY